MHKRKIINKIFKIDKRLILGAFLIFLGVLISIKSSDVKGGQVLSPVPFEKTDYLEEGKAKIKEGGGWKPNGWGTGEYLESIPIIKAGVVLDLVSGEVIWSMNLKERVAPASLTKVATVITALDLESVDEQLEVSQGAADQIPTKIGVKEGEKLKLGEAISAAILTSANDATEVISSSIGRKYGNGTEDFEKLVNFKLKKIGTENSNFVTSTGLDDDNHYSTVYDLAIIAHEALSNYPYVADVADDGYRRLNASGDHKLFDLPNWNALLGTYPGVNGLKIGYTENAGHVTMVSANRDGNKLLAIVIGAKSLEERELAAATLLNYGFGKKGIPEYPLGDLDLVRRFEEWRSQLTMANP